MSIRITSGKYKNKKLKVPNSAKPIRERIKLATFSILGDKVINAECLDLFAGSGNLGLESLSRGAMSCTLVDKDPNAIEAIIANTKNLDLGNQAKLRKDDATKFIVNDTGKYNIIFLDPPYQLPIRHILKHIHKSLKDNGIIVYFRPTQSDIKSDQECPIQTLNQVITSPDSHLKIIDTRTYGTTTVDFIAKR